MTILSLILAVFRRVSGMARSAQSYAELRRLDEATLKDIGLRFENGRVVECSDTLIDNADDRLAERDSSCRERSR